MPTYKYKCNSCASEFELFQSIVDDPLKKCPKCEGDIQRVITGGSGLIFKGSGFYITDYKKKKSTPAKTESSPKSTETAKPAGTAKDKK